MANNIVNISSAIKTKIQGISGLHDVYEYEVDKPDNGKYPFATITPREFRGQFGDTQRNLRFYEFNVRVYQERTEAGFGNEKTERLVREMADEITTAFDMDTTLSGMVKFIRPARGAFVYDEREVGEIRMIEIILEAMNVVDSI